MRKCLLFGLLTNVAELQPDNYYNTLLGRQRVKIHPSSVFCDKEKPRYIVFSELIATGRVYVRTVSSIEPEWIEEFSTKFKNQTSNFINSNQNELNGVSNNFNNRTKQFNYSSTID